MRLTSYDRHAEIVNEKLKRLNPAMNVAKVSAISSFLKAAMLTLLMR
jgi:hypothetical protein